MSEKLGSYKQYPVIRVDEVTNYQYVIRECPLCGEEHHHGYEEPVYDKLSHKSAHCTSGDVSGYYIVCDGETGGVEW
jgi:hypothetical protein